MGIPSIGILLRTNRLRFLAVLPLIDRLTATDSLFSLITRLDEREDLTPEEMELVELLTVLIAEYEERRYPIRKATPQQTLQHLMEARNLTQKDLWRIFGSKGITSEVFHGKRSISKAQAKKLAAFFHVGVELFI